MKMPGGGSSRGEESRKSQPMRTEERRKPVDAEVVTEWSEDEEDEADFVVEDAKGVANPRRKDIIIQRCPSKTAAVLEAKAKAQVGGAALMAKLKSVMEADRGLQSTLKKKEKKHLLSSMADISSTNERNVNAKVNSDMSDRRDFEQNERSADSISPLLPPLMNLSKKLDGKGSQSESRGLVSPQAGNYENVLGDVAVDNDGRIFGNELLSSRGVVGNSSIDDKHISQDQLLSGRSNSYFEDIDSKLSNSSKLTKKNRGITLNQLMSVDANNLLNRFFKSSHSHQSPISTKPMQEEVLESSLSWAKRLSVSSGLKNLNPHPPSNKSTNAEKGINKHKRTTVVKKHDHD
eukprot:GDKJ01029932.1.p1 GENE.GDKJ01029932.1~~GDKJ01029932.1.p1  ORF type:complete len:406 (-),score=118.93 GDKJ01029932.1:82-1125(-)